MARHRAGLVYSAFLAANRSLAAPLALEDPCLPHKASLALPLPALLASPCTNYTDTAFLAAVSLLEDQTVTLFRASSPSSPSSPTSPTCSSTVAAAFQPSLCSSTYAQVGPSPAPPAPPAYFVTWPGGGRGDLPGPLLHPSPHQRHLPRLLHLLVGGT